MVREYILTAILYNSEITSVLDFVVQCQEMYKDDVVKWGEGTGKPKKDWFVEYSMQYIGMPFDLIKNIRDSYVHTFDEEYDLLYDSLKGLTVSDISCLCNYFHVLFDVDKVTKALHDGIDFVGYMLDF